MKNLNLYNAIKTMYLINEFAKETECGISYGEPELVDCFGNKRTIGFTGCEYNITLKEYGEEILDMYKELNDECEDDDRDYYKNLFTEFPELKRICYLELSPVNSDDFTSNLYIYNGKVYTDDVDIFNEIEYEELVHDIYDYENLEKWKRVYQVPSNVEIQEPTNFGEDFQYKSFRDNVLRVLFSNLDTAITFEDDKTYVFFESGKFVDSSKALADKMKLYEVPCSKAKKIVIDEFERECHVIFEKKSDYFDEQYLKKE